MRRFWVALGAGLLLPQAAWAQAAGAGAPCAQLQDEAARRFCYTVAQTAESAQPQIGILLAGGNATPGTASTGGLRLGVIPGLSLTGKVNVVLARLPDITESDAGSGSTDEITLPAPALSATASLGVLPGLSIAPTVGGIGAVDLLGSVSWLPFKAFEVPGFSDNTASASFGVGARIGLLKESFTLPGASVSLMYHRLGEVAYGDVCDPGAVGVGGTGDGYRYEFRPCAGAEGDPGEFRFELTDLSARAQISKSLLFLGLAAGVGYDRWSSPVSFGVRTPCPTATAVQCAFRVDGLEVDNDRWSVFGNAAIRGIFASLVAEGGWLQGADPIAGYPAGGNEFDPNKGTLFGSVGVRLSL